MPGALERVAAQAGSIAYGNPGGKRLRLDYASYTLEVVYFGGSRGEPASLTVSASFTSPLDLGLSVQGRAPDIWGRFAPSFSVHADEPARAHALLTEPVQTALMRALAYTERVKERPCVALTDAGITILTLPSAHGQLPYGPDGYLAYLMSAAAEVVTTVEVARASVPSAASLVGLAQQMDLVARDTGMRFTLAPLGLAGRRLGIECRARVARKRALDYELVVHARFPEPIRLELALDDCMKGPAFLTELFFSRPRFTTGDAVFDSWFDLRVYDQARAQAVFSPTARRQLLQLRQLGPVRGDDTGLTLRLAVAGATGASVLGALVRISDAAATMLGKRLPGEGSAYR